MWYDCRAVGKCLVAGERCWTKSIDQGEAGLMKVSFAIYKCRLRFCFAALATIFLCVPALSAAAQANVSLENVMKQMDAQAADFRSLSANMERTKVTVVVNDKSTESGRILVRRDDKMLIEVTQPDPRTILRNGD